MSDSRRSDGPVPDRLWKHQPSRGSRPPSDGGRCRKHQPGLCLDRAADEKAEDARPALTSSVSNFEDYDVVFLGFPNWWYTLPMPVLSFVDEYDWSGKTVVPFVTHGTGGLSATVRDLTAALPEDVTVLDAIGVYRADIPHAQADVQSWAAGLNLEV